MINSIELRNWKTHKATKLNFSKGTNILIGQMGAGKSSVMDAISFALFGKFPAIQQRRVNVSGIIKSRPGQEQDALVRLTFTAENDTYTVERAFGMNGDAKATLEKNGTYVQSQPQRVTEEIAKVLKVDYDLFSKAVYSEQNGLDYFLSLGAGDRKKQIDRLLGLDRFAAAQENATSLINKIRDIVEEDEKFVSGLDMEKVKRQLDSLTKEHDAAAKEIELLAARAKKLKADAKASDERLLRLKGEQTRKISLNRELSTLRGSHDTLIKELKELQEKKLGDKADAERGLKDIAGTLDKAKAAEKSNLQAERDAQARLAKARADIEAAKKRIDERKKLDEQLTKSDLKGLEKAVETARADVQQAEKDLAAASSSIEENDKWIMALKKHISKCPVCERDLSDDMIRKLSASKEDIVRRARDSEKALKGRIAKGRSDIEKTDGSINSLRVIQEKLKELSGVDAMLDDLSKRLRLDETAYEASKKAHDAATALAEKLKEDGFRLRERLDAIEKRDAYLKRDKEVAASIEHVMKQLSEAKVEDKDVDAAQKEVTDAKAAISRLDAESEAKDRFLRDKASQMNEKKDEVARVEKIHSSITRKKEAIDNLAKFKNALEEAQVQMRARLIGAINDAMQDIWPELYPYGDYTGILLDATAEDYVLRVKTRKNGADAWESVEAIASGGERSIGCLAMRVAFALVLVPNLKWLILDEPTHNIDREGLGKFVGVFNEILPRMVDQVFIITHDDLLKQVSSAKIYQFNRNKEEGGSTVAIEV